MENIKIDITTYALYRQHGGECLWTSDSRVSRPNGTSELTDKQFSIIEQLIDNLTMLNTNMYSKELESEFQKEIANLSTMFETEVFELIKNKIINR